MRDEPHLNELDPIALLEFFKKIKHPHDVNLKHGKVATEIEDTGWAKIMVVLNGYQFICFVPVDWHRQIGGVIFMENCRQAWDEAAFLVFDRMTDWIESIYEPWIKNDTGKDISEQFLNIILKEIERLQELFQTEKD